MYMQVCRYKYIHFHTHARTRTYARVVDRCRCSCTQKGTTTLAQVIKIVQITENHSNTYCNALQHIKIP